ncbi:xanthine dehydrogenase family protein molybdopterin-binding subunit [Aurantivibrio plasticivorans]
MKFTRRKLLVGTGVVGAGLVLGISLRGGDKPLPHQVAGSFQPNAWLQITPEGRVIFQMDKAEMGQGVYTSLTTIISEGLDYPPAEIDIEMAGVHPAYANAALGMQVTGGSTSVTTAYRPLLEAGAKARQLLLHAAAAEWGVAVDRLETQSGQVVDTASNRKAPYEKFASTAQALLDSGSEIPPAKLPDPKSYRWIGQSLSRFNTAGKLDGSLPFAGDMQMDGMKVAMVIRCPHFGGSVKSVDASQAETLPGVAKIFSIYNGVAVVADGYWQALQATKAINVEWDKGPLVNVSSASIRAAQEKAIAEPEKLIDVVDEGDVSAVSGDKQVSAVYGVPYQHHSTMEPQVCVALVKDGRCEVWTPNQAPDLAQSLIAQFTGMEKKDITVNTTFLGGGFGRRAMTDYAAEAAVIAQAMPGTPIKLQWSREDDMQHDFYRPSSLHKLSATIASSSEVTSWQHRVSSASIIKGFASAIMDSYMPSWLPEKMADGLGRFASNVMAGADKTIAEGAAIPYSIGNRKVDISLQDPGIPLGFWRSVGHSHTAFAVESFMDEVAHAASRDPADIRRAYLQNHPRHLGVLEAVLKASNWGNAPEGVSQGLAVHESFSSFVAEVVEVRQVDNSYQIERILCAVDCGRVINPDGVVEQIESAVNYGLSGALKPGVEIAEGRVVQSNFHDLSVLRMRESAPIEVVIVPSDEHPTGVGEIGLPPVAPALANALFAASGRRQRELPLQLKIS